MIFIAVTMGFFAESLREHMNDRVKEKEYMHSLIEGLKYDTLKYQKVINDLGILKPEFANSFINYKTIGLSYIKIAQMENNQLLS